MREYLIQKLLLIPAIMIGFTVHEYAHALVADKLGDKTPKFQGRLTLNPIAHIDIFGFIMILLVGFGWAKPVQTNPSAYKHGYKDDLKVSVAGVIANLITAFVFSFVTIALYKIFNNTQLSSSQLTLSQIVISIAYGIVSINCMLGIFNLLPIPGLDGFHIIRDLFPKFFYNNADALYKYQYIILIVLIMPFLPGSSSILTYVIGKPVDAITSLFIQLASIVIR